MGYIVKVITELECLCVIHALELAQEELSMYEQVPDYVCTSGIEVEIEDALLILRSLVQSND